MTIQELRTILESINGFSNKVCYFAWPENEAPELPYICFYTSGSDNFSADNIVFHNINHFIVELYSRNKDPKTEVLVEAALNAAGIYWEKGWDYIEDERCFITAYQMEV